MTIDILFLDIVFKLPKMCFKVPLSRSNSNKTTTGHVKLILYLL